MTVVVLFPGPNARLASQRQGDGDTLWANVPSGRAACLPDASGVRLVPVARLLAARQIRSVSSRVATPYEVMVLLAPLPGIGWCRLAGSTDRDHRLVPGGRGAGGHLGVASAYH